MSCSKHSKWYYINKAEDRKRTKKDKLRTKKFNQRRKTKYSVFY